VQNVEVGVMGSKLAEIKEGLNPGDRVIAAGQDKYQEDEEVSPLLISTPASETAQQSGGMIDLRAEEAAPEDSNPRTDHPGSATPEPARRESNSGASH